MNDVEWEFEGPGECGACQAMVGTISDSPIGQIHPNCKCSSKPRCNNKYDHSFSTTRYGEGGRCFTISGEITVTCWDGSQIGQSVQIDMGCDWNELEDAVFEAMESAIAAEAEALESGCPDCKPPAVS